MSQTDEAPEAELGAWASILLIAATWGTSFAFIRLLGDAQVPAFQIAGVRSGLSACAVAAWVLLSRRRLRVRSRDIRSMALLGITNGLVPNVLTALALDEIATAPAALIQASTPLFVAVGAHWALRTERLTTTAVAGLLLGLIGVLVLIGPAEILAGHASPLGAGCMVLAAICYATSTVYLRATRPPDPVAIALGQQICAAFPALLIVLLTGRPGAWSLTPSSWAAFAGLAWIATAIPIVVFFRLVGRVSARRAASVQYLLPVAATIYAVTLLGETVPTHALAGGLIVLAGVWLVNRVPRPR